MAPVNWSHQSRVQPSVGQAPANEQPEAKSTIAHSPQAKRAGAAHRRRIGRPTVPRSRAPFLLCDATLTFEGGARHTAKRFCSSGRTPARGATEGGRHGEGGLPGGRRRQSGAH